MSTISIDGLDTAVVDECQTMRLRGELNMVVSSIEELGEGPDDVTVLTPLDIAPYKPMRLIVGVPGPMELPDTLEDMPQFMADVVLAIIVNFVQEFNLSCSLIEVSARNRTRSSGRSVWTDPNDWTLAQLNKGATSLRDLAQQAGWRLGRAQKVLDKSIWRMLQGRFERRAEALESTARLLA